MEANDVYLSLLRDIKRYGKIQECRNYTTVECTNYFTTLSMNQPLMTISARKLGYRFACAEAAWILSGDSKVSTISPYSKMISKFSDDGVHYFGAYGVKIMDQIEYLGRAFKKDLFTRQAVINIWREKPPASNDIPCTLNLQFMLRMEAGELTLNVNDNMRSSDAWLGIPYDWFSISMVGAYVAIYLSNLLGVCITLGNLRINTMSQHLYKFGFKYDFSNVDEVIRTYSKVDFEYEPLDISEFKDGNSLVQYLWDLAENKGEGSEQYNWLDELKIYWRNRE